MSECPIDGCTLRTGEGQLLCRAHWRQVQKPLQDAVNKGKEAADMIRIRKADNGKYYLPKGDYRVVLKGSFGTKETTCRIE